MLKRHLPLVLVTFVLLGLAIGAVLWLNNSPPSSATEPVAMALSEQATSVAGEFPPPGDSPLGWPQAHGAKLDQFAEYWLFAGLLADATGREYGFQLALFRLALQAEEPERESAWATRDVYRAHLVISAADDTLHTSERYSRGALGLSGTSHEPIRMWLENWQVAYDEESRAFHLKATDAGYGLDLRLALPAHEPQEIKGAGYRGYWAPGLVAEGELMLNGRSISVSGEALLDRLWGQALPAGRGQLALSRLWLALEDGSALRCRQLQRRTGGGTPIGECLVSKPNGTVERLEADRVSLTPGEEGWRVLDGVRYPLHWHLRLNERAPSLQIAPFADDERAPFALPLWSGVVQVSDGAAGWGLLELSNYPAR